ncbi:MAG: FAD-dependent oxidoreductase [Candidatus Malihini olakiniferum]
MDRERRRVFTVCGETGYDHLVIGTAARPMMPPWQGIHLEGGFRIREDVDAMLAAVCANAPVVVIGGGLLGIEAEAVRCASDATISLIDLDRQTTGRNS